MSSDASERGDLSGSVSRGNTGEAVSPDCSVSSFYVDAPERDGSPLDQHNSRCIMKSHGADLDRISFSNLGLQLSAIDGKQGASHLNRVVDHVSCLLNRGMLAVFACEMGDALRGPGEAFQKKFENALIGTCSFPLQFHWHGELLCVARRSLKVTCEVIPAGCVATTQKWRYIQVVDIHYNPGVVKVYNVHLTSSSRFHLSNQTRDQTLTKIARHAALFPEIHGFIAGGDMNCNHSFLTKLFQTRPALFQGATLVYARTRDEQRHHGDVAICWGVTPVPQISNLQADPSHDTVICAWPAIEMRSTPDPDFLHRLPIPLPQQLAQETRSPQSGEFVQAADAQERGEDRTSTQRACSQVDVPSVDAPERDGTSASACEVAIAAAHTDAQERGEQPRGCLTECSLSTYGITHDTGLSDALAHSATDASVAEGPHPNNAKDEGSVQPHSVRACTSQATEQMLPESRRPVQPAALVLEHRQIPQSMYQYQWSTPCDDTSAASYEDRTARAHIDASQSFNAMQDTSDSPGPSASQSVVWSSATCLLSCMLPDFDYVAYDNCAELLSQSIVADASKLLEELCLDLAWRRTSGDDRVLHMISMGQNFKDLFHLRRWVQPDDSTELTGEQISVCWNLMYEQFVECVASSDQASKSTRRKRSCFNSYIHRRFGHKRFVIALLQTGNTWLPQNRHPDVMVNALLQWSKKFRNAEVRFLHSPQYIQVRALSESLTYRQCTVHSVRAKLERQLWQAKALASEAWYAECGHTTYNNGTVYRTLGEMTDWEQKMVQWYNVGWYHARLYKNCQRERGRLQPFRI